MKFTKTSGLAVLGLAGNAVAEGWEAVSPVAPSSVVPVSTVSVTWADWSAAVSTVTVTETTTVFKATKSVICYSTIFVTPESCATTAVTVDVNGKPHPAAASTGIAPAGGSDKWPAAPAGTTPPPKAPQAVTPPAGGAWPTVTAIDPAKPTDGNWLDWADNVSTIGTNDDVFTWTGDAPTPTVTVPVPTYTGWGNGTTPGSPNANVTVPQGPITGGGSCNTAGDRSKWCGGQNIGSDHYNGWYTTGNICSYDFTIAPTALDFDGSGPKPVMAINGQVPGPLIECNWGDTLQVTVHNKLTTNSTTIHWHGILQRGSNDQDGVPGITECAIAPGQSRTYTMYLGQYGTGWYHSHALTQYGDGIRGPMVIHGPATANYDIDMGPVMIDDTFPGTAAQQADLIAHIGPTGTVNYLLNGHNTLPDLSAGQHTLWKVQPGKKHLFRFINSASQNMWSVHIDKHVMTVIATDYVPIVPYQTEWLNIGIGQRYDVIVEMNQATAGYFLRAVAQTGCPSGSANSGLGGANGIILYDGAPATLPTSTYGNKTAGDFAICADEPIGSLVPFVPKAAGSLDAFQSTATNLPAGNVARVATSDDGTVFRWFLNNGAINVNFTQPTLQTLAQGGTNSSSLISNPITLSIANQWYYFIIQNQFFASHPMHLHGHDFSILGQGTTNWTPDKISTLNFVNPPRRDTAMLAGSSGPGNPPGYTVIGFETDNPGAWLMHCHIVWHVDGGLALQFTERPSDIKPYANSQAFQNECSSLSAWEAANPQGVHTSGQSGLKRRTFFDRFMETRSTDVVRRGDSAEKQYLESNLKRGLGDGFRARHIRH